MKIAAAITDTCVLTVKVAHGSAPAQTAEPVIALLAIELEDGTGAPLNTLMVPLEVKYSLTDAIPVTLEVVGGLAESGAILACLRLP